MNMKKIIALLLLVSCFSLAFVSCKDNNGGDNTADVGGEQSGNQQENSGDNNQDNDDENPPVDNTPDDDNKDEENKDEDNKDEDENQTPDKFIPDPITYEEYEALSPDEKLAYFESFTDYNDFYAWFNKAKEEYDASHKPPEIGDNGEIDIGGN